MAIRSVKIKLIYRIVQLIWKSMMSGISTTFFLNFGGTKKQSAMQNILLHTHSVLRWIALLLLLITIVKSFSGWFGNKTFTNIDKKLSLFTLISIHLQLVIGLWLYAIFITAPGFDFGDSMKNPVLRFFSVEHIAGMLVAIIVFTIGYIKAKRASSDKSKFKIIAIFFTIALILILAMIPWPWMEKFRIMDLKWI